MSFTSNTVHLYFANVHHISICNYACVSEKCHIACTADEHSCTVRSHSWPLTAQRVVIREWRSRVWLVVRQRDSEIVRSESICRHKNFDIKWGQYCHQSIEWGWTSKHANKMSVHFSVSQLVTNYVVAERRSLYPSTLLDYRHLRLRPKVLANPL